MRLFWICRLFLSFLTVMLLSLSLMAKDRVLISTDIGGSDPDDYQSMVHLLLYADMFDIEGLISSPPGAGRANAIYEVLNAYETDYSKLKASSAAYPTPDSLRSLVRQGATDAAPSAGYSQSTPGSKLIVSAAKQSDSRPLYILAWGSITDVAQALHDDPSIKDKIRVYYIGSWNTKQDPYSRNYVYNQHKDLWFIENDSTFRGMYYGGTSQSGYDNSSFLGNFAKGKGALGDLIYNKKSSIKMGDTPSVLYMLNGNQNSPTTSSWGGMFRRDSSHGANYFTDLTDSQYQDGKYPGAKTVNTHRMNYLEDFRVRLARLDAVSTPEADGTGPSISLNGLSSGQEISNDFSIEANVSDSSGVSSVQIQLISSGGSTYNLGTLSSSPYKVILNSSNYPDGAYSIKVTAQDSLNNSSSKTVSVTIKNEIEEVPSSGTTIENYNILANFTVSFSTMNVNELFFADRSYRVTDAPSAIAGLPLLKTKNSDKDNTSSEYIRIESNKTEGKVYVALDQRLADREPQWLSNFKSTNMQINTTDTSFLVYEIDVKANEVITLGGNQQGMSSTTGKCSNYFVIFDLNSTTDSGGASDDSGSTDSGSTDSGSTDSGSADSGSTDSGSTDSGSTDSGSTDSGSTDSGSTDSGSTDSGSTDSGSADSGSTDSGSTDSGSSDSGSTDSGSSDSGSTDSGSSDSGSADSGSASSGDDESGFYAAFNMGGDSVTVDGLLFQNGIPGENGYLSFIYGRSIYSQEVQLSPAVSDSNLAYMLKTFSYRRKGTNFQIDQIDSDLYEIYVYVFEDNNSEVFNLVIEGQQVKTITSGSQGSWQKHGPFQVDVTDGVLDIETSGGAANISGIVLFKK